MLERRDLDWMPQRLGGGPWLFQRECGLSATRMAGIMIISMVAVHEDASWRFS
jgi:hypothetical protein